MAFETTPSLLSTLSCIGDVAAVLRDSDADMRGESSAEADDETAMLASKRVASQWLVVGLSW